MPECEGVVGLEMASGCCESRGLGTVLTASEKTCEDAGEAQKSFTCRCTRKDRGWCCGFMQDTRAETGELGAGSGRQ